MSEPVRPTPAGRWLTLAEELVGRAAPRLNALNLFPVPDADTGSNMHATLSAARAGVQEGMPADLGDVMERAGEAALDAARGNSGTLLAVTLSGMAAPLRGCERLDVGALAAAFASADRAARAALSEPQEGTMLTVLTAAAQSLARSADSSPGEGPDGLEQAVTAMVADARRAVEGTEAQLPALRDAQVVDSGAVGLLWVLEALRAVVTGTAVDAELAAALHGYAEETREAITAAGPEADSGALGVEVMCSLALTPLDAAGLRGRLEAVGDSLILAPLTRHPDERGRVSWRVHVHVPRVEDALAVLEAAGEPEGLTVTDLSAHGTHHGDGPHGG